MTVERKLREWKSKFAAFWQKKKFIGSKAQNQTGLKEGDKSTKFFHAKVTSRRRKNKIWGVENDKEKWIKDDEGVKKQFYGYFANLFSSSNPSPNQLEAAL